MYNRCTMGTFSNVGKRSLNVQSPDNDPTRIVNPPHTRDTPPDNPEHACVVRVTLEVHTRTRDALKAKAGARGLTLKQYILLLAKRDGAEVPGPSLE